MKSVIARAMSAATLLLAVVQPAIAGPLTLSDWRHDVHAGHALVGKIWSVGENGFVGQQELLQVLQAVPVVLLGEKHDNADHHRLQAQIVQALASEGMRPALVFEMLTPMQDDAEAAIHDPDISWSALDSILAWSDRGWPEWDSYRRILAVARRSRLPVLPGNAQRQETHAVSRAGLDHLSNGERERLALNAPLPVRAQQQLDEELMQSHCGHLPEAALPGMAAVQRLRDARLADAVLRATARGRPAVLIAGAGHVRKDRAVPLYLMQRVPGLVVISIAIREVDASETDPAAYAGLEKSDGSVLYDYVIFTPRVDDDDPCDTFAHQFGKTAD
ncbi:MAG: ChaN family lipoprotein [Alphaproteobacteria bacterium]